MTGDEFVRMVAALPPNVMHAEFNPETGAFRVDLAPPTRKDQQGEPTKRRDVATIGKTAPDVGGR